MVTMEEKRAAAKLYSLLYTGKNIYNAGNKKGGKYNGHKTQDAVIRFALIAREFKQFMKEIENG